jgi:hypothetical protein
MHDGVPCIAHSLIVLDGNSSTSMSTTTSYLTETVAESTTSTEFETSPLPSQDTQVSSSTPGDASDLYITQTYTEFRTRVSYDSARSTDIPYTTLTYTPTIYYYFTTITSEPASYRCKLEHLARAIYETQS